MSQVLAVDDDYLKMIEDEAVDLEIDKMGQLQGSENKAVKHKSFSWDGELKDDNLPKGLAKGEFETVLHENFFGTYIFFKKLNSIAKDKVYSRYSKDLKPHIDNVRKNIMLFKQ